MKTDFKNSKLLSYKFEYIYSQNLHEDAFSKNHEIYRIAVFLKGKNGKFNASSYVRLILTLYHPQLYGKIVPFIITDEDLKNLNREIIFEQEFNCVIVQRDVLNEDFSRFLVQKCKEKNIKLIYEIDDDLLNIDKSHVEYNFYLTKKGAVQCLVDNADLITVSTNELKKKFQKYNKNIKTIPNVLDEQLWLGSRKSNPKTDQSTDTIKIGYIGSFTHDDDIMLIKDAILNLKRKKNLFNKKLKFYVIGGIKNSANEEWIETIEIPSDKKDYPNFVKWLKEIVDWDIVVAPLSDTNLNRCKSELKYLEYTALGLPGVYSDIGPYSKVIKNELNGLLVKDNSTKNWENQISKLIENRILYNTILNYANSDIMENYLLKDVAEIWDDLLYDLIEGKPKKIDAANEKIVVYTAITGDYDNLKTPVHINDNLDYICFTNNKDLKSDFWEIRVMEDLDLDNIRKARKYKILAHNYLSDYDYSLWVDANFRIVGDLEDFINKYVEDGLIMVAVHPKRNCVYEEAEACISLKKDSEEVIVDQINKYRNEEFPENQGMIASGILFRKHNDPKVIKIMNNWWEELNLHSYRDQLSFNYVCWKNKFDYDKCDILYLKNLLFLRNEYFEYELHGE